MAKFVFRLQNVLNMKLNMETQAKSAFAIAQRKLNEEEAVLDGMFRQKSELEEKYRNEAQGILEVRDLLETRRAIDYTKERINEQMEVIKAAAQNLEIARARLNEVMKERKTYEKLREHAFEDFLRELADEEKKEIDELVSYRFNENGAEF